MGGGRVSYGLEKPLEQGPRDLGGAALLPAPPPRPSDQLHQFRRGWAGWGEGSWEGGHLSGCLSCHSLCDPGEPPCLSGPLSPHLSGPMTRQNYLALMFERPFKSEGRRLRRKDQLGIPSGCEGDTSRERPNGH